MIDRARRMRPSRRLLWLFPAVGFGVTALWLIGDHSASSLLGLTLSIGGAGIAAYLVRDRPVGAFAILLALAAVSRLTVELPPGTMRLEQPAIATVLLALLVEGRAWLRPNRAAAPIILGLGLFLTTLALSSVLMAPQPLESLRIVAWFVLSIGAGIEAFLLLRGKASEATPWLAGVGAAAAAAGVLVAILFLVVGQSWTLGIQGIEDGFLKVFAIAWEANLFASFLAAMLPFAIERFRGTPSVGRGGVILLITMGIALAVTRGAYLGLAFGLPVQFVALAYWGSPWRRLVMPAGVVLACLLVSAPAPTILLPANRPGPPTAANPSPSTGARPSAIGTSQVVGSSPTPSASVLPPAATESPLPVLSTPPRPYPDTIGFRLARVPPALDDLARSPLIGLGAASFGQRHADASQGGAPDHLGILLLAVPYDSGILGAAGFGVATVALLILLARCLRGPGATPVAAAYLGSLVSLLVAYQATNAIHFAINWLIAGAAAALVADVTQLRRRGISSTERGSSARDVTLRTVAR